MSKGEHWNCIKHRDLGRVQSGTKCSGKSDQLPCRDAGWLRSQPQEDSQSPEAWSAPKEVFQKEPCSVYPNSRAQAEMTWHLQKGRPVRIPIPVTTHSTTQQPHVLNTVASTTPSQRECSALNGTVGHGRLSGNLKADMHTSQTWGYLPTLSILSAKYWLP